MTDPNREQAAFETLSRRLAVFRHDAPRRPTPAALGVLVLIAAVGISLWSTRGPDSWSTETMACSGCTWVTDTPLDTTGSATARIADRGTLLVSPGTQLWRRTATGAHLELKQGHLEVLVDAEAEWLTVALPGVELVDLGCAFVVDVDPQGHGLVQVSAGAVALRSPVSRTILPAGTLAATWPDGRTGLAVSHKASKEFIALVDSFERDGQWQPVVTQAGLEDTITLWHLLDRAPAQPVIDRLTTLLGADVVDGERLGQGDPEARDELLSYIVGRTL